MSLLRRIEALEATIGAQTTSSGPDEIWLIGVSPDGSRECGGGWVKDKGLFRNATAEEAQRRNKRILQGENHG
ncbi:hypothetical protein [Pantoea dispersa]|uniref:hypothetical protein n=1 Tax=Pantoea dispersa TaxID=59814 RepID=UPI000F678FE4|nr:hypothetical protein [Pantoea dispersa]RRW66975.1 hypothetical protein EGJ48_20265 [Pantoea dispersa]